MKRPRKLSWKVVLAAAVMAFLTLVTFSSPGMAAEKPRYGGELIMAVPKDPPSFDGHRENTFALIHPVAPHYSLLLKFDQYAYGILFSGNRLSSPSQ